MEWWILSGLALAVLALGALTRLRRLRRRQVHEPAHNIYPLW
jgi:hypothetical protein